MADLTSGRTAVLVHRYPLRIAAIERALRAIGIAIAGKGERRDDARELVEAHQPDLLVLEIEPFEDTAKTGDLVSRLREERPELRIIAFSPRCDLDRIDAALGAGAAAYVVDTPDRAELAAAVHQAVIWVFSQRRAETARLAS